jgi:hypothetical protein
VGDRRGNIKYILNTLKSLNRELSLPRVHTGCPQGDSRLQKVALHLVTGLALGNVLEFYGTYIRISCINSTQLRYK